MRGFKEEIQGRGGLILDRHHEARRRGGGGGQRWQKMAAMRSDSGSVREKRLTCVAHMSVTGEREGGATRKTQLQGEDAFSPRCEGRMGRLGERGQWQPTKGEQASAVAWAGWARFQERFKMDLNFEFQ
jgi:hypothetical protein